MSEANLHSLAEQIVNIIQCDLTYAKSMLKLFEGDMEQAMNHILNGENSFAIAQNRSSSSTIGPSEIYLLGEVGRVCPSPMKGVSVNGDEDDMKVEVGDGDDHQKKLEEDFNTSSGVAASTPNPMVVVEEDADARPVKKPNLSDEDINIHVKSEKMNERESVKLRKSVEE